MTYPLICIHATTYTPFTKPNNHFILTKTLMLIVYVNFGYVRLESLLKCVHIVRKEERGAKYGIWRAVSCTCVVYIQNEWNVKVRVCVEHFCEKGNIFFQTNFNIIALCKVLYFMKCTVCGKILCLQKFLYLLLTFRHRNCLKMYTCVSSFHKVTIDMCVCT